MRIVYLNPCGQLGGAETSLLELLTSVRAAAPNWEISLVLGEDGPLTEEARTRGVNVIVAPFPAELARLGDARNGWLAGVGALLRSAAGTVRYRKILQGILASLRPDILHTNGFKMHLLGAWARSGKTPLVWHIHDYVGSRRLARSLLRLFHKACGLAVANSRSVANDLRTLLPDLKIVSIYNAIDLERFNPEGNRLDLDALAGLPTGPSDIVRVGLVATFARWKGHQVFLQALARLSKDANVRGYIVGGPIYQTSGSQWTRSELEQESNRLGLREKVGFTGFVRDTAAAMRSLDIIVHASTEPEPFGMVIVEGMACGKAVIASKAGGAAELFKDGEDALGHPPGNDTVLAQQISRLVSDQQLRVRMGRQAREASQQYRGTRLAVELLAVYRELTKPTCESSPRFKPAPLPTAHK